jgi:seryl-tRNA synthetase
MIDIKRAKADVQAYKKNISDRNLTIDFDGFLVLDEQKNILSQKIDELRNTKNLVSKEIPRLSDEERGVKIVEMKKLGEELEQLEQEYKPLEEKCNYILHRLPNFLDPNAAIGKDDGQNRAEEFFMEKTSFDFTPKDHMDIALAHDWANLEK